MLITLNKEQIAVLLKNESVIVGIEKESKGIKLPQMNTTSDVLEYIGSQILSKMDESL